MSGRVTQVTTPDDEFGTVTLDTVYESGEYTMPTTVESRVASFGIFSTDEGFESRIVAHRRDEAGGLSLAFEASVLDSSLEAAQVALGSLRERAGVPASTPGSIVEVGQRAHPPDGAGGGAPPRPPTPQDRSHAGPDQARPPTEGLSRIVGTGPEPGPAGRAEMLAPEVPRPPESIEVPSDVADWVDHHLDQFDRAVAEWPTPVSAGLRVLLPVPGMAPQDWTDNVRGVTDLLRIGQGTAEGGVRGVLADLSRALGAFPQLRGISRIVGIASYGTAAAQVAESVASGDGVSAGDVLPLATAVAVAVAGGSATKAAKKRAAPPPVIASGGKQPRTISMEDFVATHVDRTPLTAAERDLLRKRVQELHAALDKRGRAGKTTALVVARDQDGELQILVSSSEKSVRKAVREKMHDDEIQVTGNKRADPDNPNDHFHHAEVNGINVVVNTGWQIVEVFPSRNACPLCAQMRALLGVLINDPG